MIVAFDGICLGDGPITGVARCFLDALAAYAAAGDTDCVVLVPPNAPAPALAGVRCVVAPRGALARQWRLPALLRELRADVLHSSVASLPYRAPCPAIATVHDLPWLHPESTEPAGGLRARLSARLLARRLARADAIVAPSQMTAYDTAAWLGAAAPPIVHVPHGTELGPAPTAASTAARRGPLLALGDDRPRKNRDCVRAAHALARRHCMDLPELRFVGPPHDYVTEAEKRRLLLTCRALVQCSRFEGFGLPVLEGMAHGAPVLCSALPPHLETTGGAAYLVDPRDERSIADGMVALHRDDERRWQLAQAGHARAAMYSCTAVAEAWRRLHRGELP